MTLAPIIIFTYKRLGTLKQTIGTLKDNPLASKSELFIFSDGPKNENDTNSVNQVRDYIKQIDGFKSVKYVFSETNKGLASSVISGVSDVFKTYNSAIVLEDDLLLTPNFLAFMNQALDTYTSSNKVFSISGYSFSLNPSSKNDDDAYFLNRGWSWGWATWKDRWEQIDWEVKDYPEFEKSIAQKKAFNKGGSDLSAMLHKQMTNKLDSWGIRWLYHQFRINGLTLYPKNSKILNIGFDNQATHTTGSDSRYIPELDTSLKETFKFPDRVEITQHYQNAFQRKMGIASRIKSRIDTAIKHSKRRVADLFSKPYADKTGDANFVEVKKI
ncbi:glycosyltransferase [Mucilaginibacter gotjawali]|uniref:Glycosyltransferase 2-like domain-containing protein n=1 Tax=Mucilaginibacter gotjawali TaxID=1550579 RepID=A0A839S8A1_9SPHI|nr:glycosyltransferase [Mucilaginibacter gotjawali]MBB3054361.1 hypothetical protein [Mucilaginibacter gotjawali]